MSLRHLWAFLAVALPVLAALLAALPATDLAYQLRVGAEILETGRVPATDTWTFTAAGLPWVDQQWGAQVVLAGVYRVGGWVGLVVLRAGLVGLIAGVAFDLCRRQGLSWRLSAWLALGAFVVMAPALALRPQLFGMALFALTVLLVAERRRHPRLLWAVPLVTIAWANLHGSFFLAPAVLGLAWLVDLENGVAGRRHDTLVVAVASAIAACVTPFGPAVWAYAVALGGNPEVTGRITEWQSTTLRDVPGMLFFGSALLVVALLARRGRPVPWSTLAWLGFFFVLGAYAARGVAWWPIGALAAVAPVLASVAPGDPVRVEPRGMRLANAAVAATLVVVGVVLLPIWRPIDPGLGAPVGVLSQAPGVLTGELRELAGPEDRLLAPQRWGSWFEFALPDVPVAVDSRIELFPAEVWRDYTAVVAGRADWLSILERWRVTIVVTAPDEEGFAERLVGAGWVEQFRSDEGSILVPPSAAGAGG